MLRSLPRELFQEVMHGKSLNRSDAKVAMKWMISPPDLPEELSEYSIQLAAFVGALTVRGETLDELLGFVSAIREQSIYFSLGSSLEGTPLEFIIDTCGTGGDGAGTFNISTAAAFVVAAAGVGVVKHGSESVSSPCGSADVMTALGIRPHSRHQDIRAAFKETNFAFLLASSFHPAFRHLRQLRRVLGVRTVFNLLGPLVNPAQVKRQVIGVWDSKRILKMAETLMEMGSEEVIFVSGENGIDEISISGPTQVAHLRLGKIRTFSICPEDFGFSRAPMKSIQGGNSQKNAQIISDIFTGIEEGPKKDVVLLNAGAGLQVSGKVDTLEEGVKLARKIVESGAASRKLDQIADYARRRIRLDRKKVPLREIQHQANHSRLPFDFIRGFTSDQIHFIAEVKLASPSEGDLAIHSNPEEIAGDYLSHGATAISVLTEPDFFKGSPDYLRQIRGSHPKALLLMKDFVVDEYQIYRARVDGADAILLILALLEFNQASHYIRVAHCLGLTTLIEVHDEKEMKFAIELGAVLIGINNRNLKTMKVSLETSKRLIGLAPKSAVLISESGLGSADSIQSLSSLGYRGFLIGTHFMKSPRPGFELSRLKSEVQMKVKQKVQGKFQQ